MSAIGTLCSFLLVCGLVASKSIELDNTMLRDSDEDEGGYLVPEDFQNVGNRKNEEATHDEDGNPDFFEGDVVLGNAEDREAEFNKKWPMRNGKVYIPYTIPSNFPRGSRSELADAIAEYEEKTCVRLVRRRNQKDYVKIETTKPGCYVWTIGNTGGKQVLNHDTGCSWGNMVHEFMHKLGFYHEQTRPDRDNFITVDKAAIAKYEKETGAKKGKWASQFIPCSRRGCRVATTQYDYGSIMHYSPRMGRYTVMRAKNNCPKPPCKIRYQRSGLSKLDIKGINKVYGCRSN